MLSRSGTRIAFVVSSLHGGGAEAVGIAWMNWFAEAGYDVSAVMVSDKPESDLVDPRVTVHREATTGSHAAKVRAVRRLIRAHRYDALVALQTYPNLLAIGRHRRQRERPRCPLHRPPPARRSLSELLAHVDRCFRSAVETA